jgi:peptidoglycan/LPS O-acetylase OafA/YrhL
MLKQKLISTKNFVKRNERRIVYPALVVTTASTAVMFRNVKCLNDFLKEHDLLDTFYALDEI